MTIIRVALCTLSLALLVGCASSGFSGRSAYGGGGGSMEFGAVTPAPTTPPSALPDYREILASPGAF